VDVCRHALVSLLTGDFQDGPLTKDLMEIIFEDELPSQVWFYLKLASYVHPPVQEESSFFINTHSDVRYPYYLGELQKKISFDLGAAHFAIDEKSLLYAKTLI